MNVWQRKLLAFLHDPPHKALDIQGHEKNRDTFVRQAGFDSAADMQWFDKSADHWASAADRFPAFDSGLRCDFGGAGHPFRHPLGGSDLVIPDFPTVEALAGLLQDVQPRVGEIPPSIQGEERDRINFFLHWRRWAVEAAHKDWRSAFQPADTRLPDHPVWLHNSMASALQGCRDEADGHLKPAFLLFQLGPVQEFIAQARSTRDLWSGSYLLSWLMAHAIKAITDRVGPDAVIFPFLRAQPLFDLLHRDEVFAGVTYKDDNLWKRMKIADEDILVPNLPNRFLALVPAAQGAELARAAEKAVRDELKRIADASWSWLDARHQLTPSWRDRFNLQINAFPQTTWQVWPWELDLGAAMKAFDSFGGEAAEHLRAVDRLGHNYPPNPGFTWTAHYAEVDRRLAARRNTRDAAGWMMDTKGRTLDPDLMKTAKDSFSGKEEIIGDKTWWETLPKSGIIGRLFRSEDQLGAMNLVKRVWHAAYLDQKWELRHRGFDSVPDVAAAHWLSDLRRTVRGALSASRGSFERISTTCATIQRHAAAYNIDTPGDVNDQNLDKWLERSAPVAFLDSEWKQGQDQQTEVQAALRALYRDDAVGLGKPPSYVAVLAFDGDQMGRWVSGDLTPPMAGQMSKEASDKFGPALKAVRRPLSPSYHLQFSEALANFAIHLVRPIVEAFDGQLIYAGGDDVLAMVPAASALDCAEALRAAFQGSARLTELVPELFDVRGTKGGFVQLANPREGQPSWPMVVPGPEAEASVGLAIGHMHAPLQGLVRAAQDAEKRAKRAVERKGLGRAAFAVNVYKRSGEILEWGAKWDSGALPLFREFLHRSQSGELAGKFAYALDELLAPYRNTGSLKTVAGFDVRQVIKLDLERVLDRQTTSKAQKESVAGELRTLAHDYLGHLEDQHAAASFPLLFRTAAFILRGER